MRTRPALLSTLCAMILLVTVTCACGFGDDQTDTGQTARTTKVSPVPTDPAHLVALNGTGDADVSASKDNSPLLHVHINGSNGDYDDFSATGIACDPQLSWASSHPDQATYTPQQLQDVYTYLHTVPFDRFEFPLAGAGALGVGIPNALRWVNAAQAQQQGSCLANLQVTNTSSAPITLSQVGVRYLAAPIANTYQYAKIDLCTIDLARYCFSGRGGETGQCAYTVTIPLRATGTVGTDIPGNINPAYQGCPSVVPLAPGQLIVIHLIIDPPSAGPSLIYQIAPTLTITDSTEHVVVLSELRTNLAFADAGQFTCYGESSGRVVPDSAIQYPLTDAQGNSYPQPICI